MWPHRIRNTSHMIGVIALVAIAAVVGCSAVMAATRCAPWLSSGDVKGCRVDVEGGRVDVKCCRRVQSWPPEGAPRVDDKGCGVDVKGCHVRSLSPATSSRQLSRCAPINNDDYDHEY
eukprot:2669998-Pyramimonas_sp.AAC.1